MILLVSFVSASHINYTDNFNRADNTTLGFGWTETEGANTQANITNNELVLYDNSGANKVVIDIKNATYNMSQLERIRFKYRNDDNTDSLEVNLVDNGVGNILSIRLDSVLAFHNGTSYKNTWRTIQSDESLDVDIRFIDYVSRTYQIFVNGTFIENAVFRSAAANISDEVEFQTFGSDIAYTVYLDDFYIAMEDPAIFHCHSGDISTIFRIRNISTNNLVNQSDLDIIINSSVTDQGFGLTGNNTYAFCIKPSNATYQVNAHAFYDNKYNYYLYNATFDNTPNGINLYVIDNQNTTAVSFSVTDENDNALEDVYIQVLQKDIGTGTYKTTEILKTDYLGEAIGNIVLFDNFYKFILYRNGTIILETTDTKITGLERIFRVSLTSDYFVNYNIYNGITTDLTFSNASKNFTFTFSDPSGLMAYGCLKIVQRSLINDVVLNETCLNSSAGTIERNIGAVGNFTYIGIGIIDINPEFVAEVLSVEFQNEYLRWGESAFLYVFMVVLALATYGIAISSPVIAIFMMIAGFVFSTIISIFYIGWEYMILFIILGVLAMFAANKRK